MSHAAGGTTEANLLIESVDWKSKKNDSVQASVEALAE
ncbi:MAG: hypothetical protein ACI8PQ_002960, partial [Planctomycetota bacterium]